MNRADHDELTREVGRVLRNLAPQNVRVGARAIRADEERWLLDEERAGLRGAVASRRREFAAGRALLRELTGHEGPIPVGVDRRPLLPDGVVASIAHDRLIVVGATAAAVTTRALGIDFEPVSELEPQVVRTILRPDDDANDPMAAFVAKEAAFKAWSNAGGRMMDHHDVHLAMAPEDPKGASSFVATDVANGLSVRGGIASVRYAWLALVIIAA